MSKYEIADKNRMTARLFDNMGLDAWMTFELMGAAINRVIQNDPFKGAKLISTKRDVWSSTTANVLELHNKSVDHFYNFQTIKLDGVAGGLFRHRNRPDGMFQMEIETGTSSQQMVLFYEGDKHTKDAGKSLDDGCKNSHKIYQYFAQSQSYNADMSACVIIASIDRAAEDFVTFLNDLFKAHMFAFAVIAHYNMTSDKKKTCLYKLLGLGDDFMYDFVVGINMGLTSDNVAFETRFFDDRIEKLRNFNNYNAVSITIRDSMKKEVFVFKSKIDIGLVRIVFIAVPRTAKETIQNPPGPFLIYPLHVEALVKWKNNGRQKARAQVQTSTLLPFFQYNNLPGLCNFRKNMMEVTNVLQVPPGLDDKRMCSFDETDGFFFIALPLAYYTIEQFEVVNGYLQYNWNRKFKNFDDVFDNMKDTFFDLNNTKIKVKMFSENKSLFHQICASIHNSTDDIDEDLKMFLQESCRWKEVDKFSPVIFFRTMGIFSLQNAIDFAFEMQRTESKTYLNMLSSYPMGTQILIRQCMHKLTDVTAFAYLARDATKKVSTIQDDESSEDEEHANILVRGILAVKNMIQQNIQSIGWNVDFGTGFNEKDAASIGGDLVRLYSETISDWTYVSDGALNRDKSKIVDDSSNIFVTEFMKKSQNTLEILKIKFPIDGTDMIVRFQFKNQTYHYKPVFPDKFVCSDNAVNLKVRNFPDQEEMQRVTLDWGRGKITFTKASEEQMQAMLDKITGTTTYFRRKIFG